MNFKESNKGYMGKLEGGNDVIITPKIKKIY